MRICAGVAALAMVVVGSSVVAAAPKKGGTLRIGLETDFQGFEALKAHVLGIAANTVATTLMERLQERADDGSMRPVLATDMKASDDGMVWRYTLRKGVKFHDGSEMTAEDVAFYFNRLLDPENRFFGRLFISPIKEAKVDGPHAVSLHMNHPWVAMEEFGAAYSFTTFIGQPSSIKSGEQNRKPSGTGPFVFKEWRPGDRLVVEKNPHHWNADKIHLDRIVFRIMPDQQTRFASLKSGEVDIIWTDRGASVLAAQKDQSLTVHARTGGGATIIFFNTAKPPLDDVNLRRALSHAWSQEIYVKASLRGIVPVVQHPLGPDSKCEIKKYRKHSIEDAKIWAAKAAAKEVNAIHTSTQRGREFGEIYQQLAKKAGIKLNLKPVDQVQLRKLVFTNNYDISGWRIGDVAVQSQLFALLYSKSFYNLTRYKNPEMDKLVFAMRKAATLEEYDARACDVIEKMHEDAMILFSGGRRHYAISRKNVGGIPPLWQGTIDPRYSFLTQ
jgi:4-phytase/acid phosphatase/peptide/nickel transport system substrate-binding protein